MPGKKSGPHSSNWCVCIYVCVCVFMCFTDVCVITVCTYERLCLCYYVCVVLMCVCVNAACLHVCLLLCSCVCAVLMYMYEFYVSSGVFAL